MNRDAYPSTAATNSSKWIAPDPFAPQGELKLVNVPEDYRFCRLASGSVHLYNHATTTNEPPTPQATYSRQAVIYPADGVLPDGETLRPFST